MLDVLRSEDELLQKLEAIRLICRYTGCAQRYLDGDAPPHEAHTTGHFFARLSLPTLIW